VRIFLWKNISRERKQIGNQLKYKRKKEYWKGIKEQRKEFHQPQEP